MDDEARIESLKFSVKVARLMWALMVILWLAQTFMTHLATGNTERCMQILQRQLR